MALLLAGCDFLYGVRRSAPLHSEPALDCVDRVIREAPGVASVRHTQEDGGRPLTLSGLQPPTVVQTFIYEGPNDVWGALQYTKDYKGEMSFWQCIVALNRVPPQDEVTASRPVMRYIERQLETQCGMHNLSAEITEWCHRVECPPLP